MFVSLEQPRVILACLFIGVIMGVYYEPFCFIATFFKNRKAKEIVKCTWLITFAPIYTLLSLTFKFSDFRLYNVICVLIGCAFYKFSFHKAVAIFTVKVYNVIKITFLRLKLRFTNKDERRKEKARILRVFKRTDNARYGARSDIDVSARGDNFA